MLDLPRIRQIQLSSRPRVQRFVGLALMANYRVPPGVRIELEGTEHLPDHPVLFAMNHTDRYNYWPFQYRLWRSMGRFTATWVKGKYYQNAAVGKFMELTNNIPSVSRGYLLSRDFLNTMGRPPSDEEYPVLRALVDRAARSRLGESVKPVDESALPRAVLTQPRDMLGRRFDPSREDYATCMDSLFREMMREFVLLNESAFGLGLDVLVFPQGTRSIRLSRGHIGISQIALKYGKTIVPVGCNGSDQVYPSSSPLARPGRIVYRFGPPIPFEEMEPFHVPEGFEPFTPEAETLHRERFQGLVDVVMERIDALLDEPYRFTDDRESQGVKNSSRFV